MVGKNRGLYKNYKINEDNSSISAVYQPAVMPLIFP